MGFDVGYSSAAQRRVAIWNAMNGQPAATANASAAPLFALNPDGTARTEAPKTEAPKVEAPKTEAPKVETSKTETAPAAATGSGTAVGTQLSSSTLAELLALTSEIAKRQDVAYESLVGHLKDGKTATQSVAGKVDSLSATVKANDTATTAKIDGISTTLTEQFDKVMTDLATLTARIDALTTTITP